MHRDIKPENLLCALDESTIKIIDFGISKPFSRGQPSKYDPLKERRGIAGSLYWASLNSHNGIGQCISATASVSFSFIQLVDLGPRDDIESLALLGLFLLRGSLPWKPRPIQEHPLCSQEIVRLMKSACPGSHLSTGFPHEFGDLLTYSRTLDFDQLPDYEALMHSFTSLAEMMGYFPDSDSGPLDWTPCYHEIRKLTVDEPEISIPDEDQDKTYLDPLGEDSYRGLDFDVWDRQGERSKDVTLPAKLKVEIEGTIPLIVEVPAPFPIID